MVISTVVTVDDKLAVVLSPDELKSLGLVVGDVLEVVPTATGVLLKKVSTGSDLGDAGR